MIVESYEDVIVLSGALRSNYWDTLHTAISLLLKRHPSGVIIDCSGLTEATPEGGTTFRDVMEFIRNQDARVIVAAVPQHIRDVLKSVTEVRSQLAVADSVNEARRSLDLLAEPKPQKRKTPVVRSRIVVYVTGQEVDREAVIFASQIGEARHAAIHLAYVVLVPRDLPLTAPLPKEEALASKAIDACTASIDRHLSWVPHVERGRDIPTTLQDLVKELGATLVVLPLCCDATDAGGISRLVGSVLSKISQEVVFVRGAVPQPSATR